MENITMLLIGKPSIYKWAIQKPWRSVSHNQRVMVIHPLHDGWWFFIPKDLKTVEWWCFFFIPNDAHPRWDLELENFPTASNGAGDDRCHLSSRQPWAAHGHIIGGIDLPNWWLVAGGDKFPKNGHWRHDKLWQTHLEMGGFSNAIFEVEPNTTPYFLFAVQVANDYHRWPVCQEWWLFHLWKKNLLLEWPHTTHLVVSDVQPHRHGVLVALHPSRQKRFAMIRGGHGVPESQEGPELERDLYPTLWILWQWEPSNSPMIKRPSRSDRQRLIVKVVWLPAPCTLQRILSWRVSVGIDNMGPWTPPQFPMCLRKYRTLSRFRCTAATCRPIVGLGALRSWRPQRMLLNLTFIIWWLYHQFTSVRGSRKH